MQLSEEQVSKVWLRGRERIRQARATYFRLQKWSAADTDESDPEIFVTELETELFGAAQSWSDAERTAFHDWTTSQPTTCKLSLVLAARWALRQNDLPTARKHAGHAVRIMPNHLHVQTVYRAALGKDEIGLTGWFCRAPFENIETQPNGDVHFCCPAWLPVPIGNLNEGDPENIWNSPEAQEIRRSIHDGDYRYCSRMHCPKLSRMDKTAGSGMDPDLQPVDEIKNARHRTYVDKKQTRLDHSPLKLVLSHDRSCNLSCPSCRTQRILAKKPEQERLNRMYETVLAPLLTHARRMCVTASGDPFGSAHFRHILKNSSTDRFPELRLDLQTNGVLFDEPAWRDLNLDGRIDRVAISLDAARPETYAIVRRDGDFDRLMRNLDFLSKQRHNGQIGMMRLDFVIQALNFREMPEVVDIAERFGFDSVKFQMIRNWNTYTPAEFAEHDIGSLLHPEHDDFRKVLGDPKLSGDKVELWGVSVSH